MKIGVQALASLLGLIIAAAASAQAPAGAPAGATGLCQDGTYYTGATKRGACRGHKGVKDWYGSAEEKTAAPAKAAAPAPAAAATPAAPAPAKSAPAATAAKSAPATGGGPGQVWVNTSTKVYHCSGTRWYGKTKQGEYMTEAAAKAAGDRPDHGKACS